METANQPQEGYEWKIFIFVSKLGKDVKYFVLDEGCENDGRPAEGRFATYSVKLGSGHAGTMFRIQRNIETKGITYNKKGELPVGIWKNNVDRLEWQAEQRSAEAVESLKKDATDDLIKKACEPLREAFRNLPATTHNKTVFLARIMAEITREIR